MGLNKIKMNQTNKNPSVYTEIELRALITDIILLKDKNNKDYWIIKVQIDEWTEGSYLCFSGDYNLSPETGFLLLNNKEKLINKFAELKLRKQGNRESVIGIEIDKESG